MCGKEGGGGGGGIQAGLQQGMCAVCYVRPGISSRCLRTVGKVRGPEEMLRKWNCCCPSPVTWEPPLSPRPHLPCHGFVHSSILCAFCPSYVWGTGHRKASKNSSPLRQHRSLMNKMSLGNYWLLWRQHLRRVVEGRWKFSREIKGCPWLVFLSGLRTGMWTQRSPVLFLVRTHAWVAGQGSIMGCRKGSHTYMFCSLSLKINN